MLRGLLVLPFLLSVMVGPLALFVIWFFFLIDPFQRMLERLLYRDGELAKLTDPHALAAYHRDMPAPKLFLIAEGLFAVAVFLA
jgi:hypothetical protein